jgi:hypothetical protein
MPIGERLKKARKARQKRSIKALASLYRGKR